MDKHSEPGHTSPADTPPADTRVCRGTRMRIIVSLAPTFTRAQAARLIDMAMQGGQAEIAAAEARGWGRGFHAGREHVADLNLHAIADGLCARPFSEAAVRHDRRVLAYRRMVDTAAAYPWRTDHLGGPVADWDGDPAVSARAEALGAHLAALPDIRL